MARTQGYKAALCILGLLICCSAAYAVFQRPNLTGMTESKGINGKYAVIIDPGHGGVDGGAVGVGGVVEKGLNLSISLKLRSFFEAAGYQVIMTREDDRSIHDEDANTIRSKKATDLHNRLDVINSNPDAVFLSIHQNIYSDSFYSGTQIFYSPNAESSKTLASVLQDSVRSILQPQNNREIKPAGKNLFLLYNAKTPAVMVECGFLSNPAEAAKLQDNAYQGRMAFAIFYGTLRFYSGDKVVSSEGSIT